MRLKTAVYCSILSTKSNFGQFSDYVTSLKFLRSAGALDTFLMIWMHLQVLFSIDIML